MTFPNNPKHDTPICDAIADECFVFLMGEMSAAERKQFESRLDDPAVSEELLRQSETLLQISENQSDDQLAEPNEYSKQVTREIIVDSPSLPTSAIVATLAAIAAVIFLAVTLTPPNETEKTAKSDAATAAAVELLIAKAWVAQPEILDTAAESELSADWSLETEPDLALDDELNDEGSDETFSWMVVAVESGDDVDG